MREIKFRAWDSTRSYMVPFHQFGGSVNPTDGGSNTTQLRHLESLILLQYTGLKDKNGVEIYDGDIVHITKPCGQCPSEYSEVGRNPWRRGSCAYAWDKNWEARIGQYWKREEFTTLSHNGKHLVYGSYFFRTDVTAEHFVVDSPWITENWSEVIGN